jgi:diguanylate cyclase (GGDEF)-like protein/PAS domain S-box-containing protein
MMDAKRIVGDLGKSLDRFLELDPGTAQLRSQVRAQQINAIVRTTPAMMAGNLCLGLALLYFALPTPRAVTAAAWFAVLALICGLALRSWHKSQNMPAHKHASQRAIRRAAVHAGCLGLLWGAAPSLFYSLQFGEMSATLALGMTGLICAGGFVLAPIPLAVLAFLVPVSAGSLLVLMLNPSPLSGSIAFMLVGYAGIVLSASYSQNRIYMRSMLVSATVEEQKKTISLLLKDFEAHSSDWLWETDENLKIIRASERFAQAAGRTQAELAGMGLLKLLGSTDQDAHPAIGVIVNSMERHLNFTEIEVPIRLKDESHWWSLTGMAEMSQSGVFIGYHGVGSDITFEKKADERISFLAHNDALTGLLNRAHFTEMLGQTVSRLERYGAPFALMFLDLDHFKTVNDTRGHPVGDRLLVDVSRRLRALVPPGTALARLGGDEFAIILNKAAKAADAEPLAQAIVTSLSEPFIIDGETINIGASVGIAIAPRHGTRSDQLLRNVDLALYRAKDSGRSAYRFFELSMDSQARERRALEFDLKTALQNDEFLLFYQPLIGAESNQAVGFEALLRWNHPIRGIISPAEFIPIAENSGLIKTIGDWALEEACMTAATWPEHLTIAVNLSAPQFDNARIVDTVKKALKESGLSPHRLELEITESLLIDRPDDVIAILEQLRKIGVCIAMDDFGTGYSSLSYLLKFPYDKIKIDRSFISAIATDKAACDVLRTIGALAKTLNMRVTAEGVETREQFEFLRQIACDQVQGFYFAKPMQDHELAPFLLSGLTGILPQDRGKSIAA